MSSYYEKFADGKVVCIDEEIPFEIPKGWEWARLSVSVSMNPRNTAADDLDAGFIPMTYIDPDLSNTFKFDMRKWKTIKSGFTHLADGDVAFAKITPCITNLKAAVMRGLPNGIAAGTTELNVFRCYKGTIIAEYILYYLATPYILVDAVYKGTAGQQRIMTQYLASRLLPIPPYKEQQRIVDKIKALLPVIQKYNHAQDAVNTLNEEIYSLLQKSILQEAIQGKLVPQDPSEESAGKLLERINSEKQQLVKEGKLKAKEAVPSIIFKGDDNKYYEKTGKDIVDITEEIPFEIPENWEWSRLKNIVFFNPKNVASDDTVAAFMPMNYINPGYGSGYKYDEVQWGKIKKGFSHFAKDDIAFAKITPCFQNRKSFIANNLPSNIGAGTTELIVLRPYGNTLCQEYVLFFLQSSYFVEEAKFKGTAGQQRIMAGYSENKLFPLPPYEEQIRISRKINELLASIMSR